MKGKDIALLIGGGLAAYMLIPKEAREQVTGGGGGGGISLDLSGLFAGLQFPELPDIVIPEIPQIPEIPSIIPEVPEIPGIPDIPGLPDIPGIPDIPGLPDIPGFPDLPEFPETEGKSLLEIIFGPVLDIKPPALNIGDILRPLWDWNWEFWSGWQEDYLPEGLFEPFKWPVQARGTEGFGVREVLEKIPVPEIGKSEHKADPEYMGTGPSYRPLPPTPHPGTPGVSIVGILPGSGQLVHSIGLEPPPTEAKWWMFT